MMYDVQSLFQEIIESPIFPLDSWSWWVYLNIRLSRYKSSHTSYIKQYIAFLYQVNIKPHWIEVKPWIGGPERYYNT